MPATDKSPNASPSMSHKANSTENANNDYIKAIYSSVNNDTKSSSLVNKTNDKTTNLNNKNETNTPNIKNSKNTNILTAPTHPPPPVPAHSNVPEIESKETKGIQILI